MSRPYAGAHYTRVAIALHWIIALLILANLAIGLWQETWLKGTMPLHKSIGLTVLLLSVVRLGWRLAHRPPPLPNGTRAWEKRLAHLNHGLFYLLMFLLPLSGWVFTSAGSRKYPTVFWGMFPVPPIVGQNPALSDTVATRHMQMAYLMIALIVLHLAGVAKHQFLNRDRTLERIWPGTAPR